MAILDVFKKKEEEKPEVIQKEEKPKIKKGKDFAWQVLVKPHVSEKATDLSEKSQHIFQVFPNVNKDQIKKAVKELYGVEVIDVKIINIPTKKKRFGRFMGHKSGYKKAIVKLKPGQKIDLISK